MQNEGVSESRRTRLPRAEEHRRMTSGEPGAVVVYVDRVSNRAQDQFRRQGRVAQNLLGKWQEKPLPQLLVLFVVKEEQSCSPEKLRKLSKRVV